MIQFVANYDDLSTDRGYQFKFYCDKCGNGHMSEYKSSKVGLAAGLLQSAGQVFGGLLGRVGDNAYSIQQAVGGKAHDEALQQAVVEGKKHFRQCTRCGKWVCPEVCWNESAGLCEACAPDEAEELAAQQALATAEQIHTQVREQDLTGHLDLKKRSGLNVCRECGRKNPAQSKFCCGCGQALPQPSRAAFCGQCGHKISDEKFCPQCGSPQV
jgi:hypothetical protein